MFGVFLFHLLVVLLLPPALLLAHALQTLPPLVLLHHLIPLELVVAALVKVLQVFGGLKTKRVKLFIWTDVCEQVILSSASL